MKRSPWLPLLILVLVLAGCRNGAATTIDLTISDYQFTPDRFTVPAGQEITLNVDNQGFVSHQFVIFKSGTNPGEKFDAADQENVYWIFEIPPGREGTAAFMAPSEPGEYFFVCGIFGHLEAGMFGTLVVVEND